MILSPYIWLHTSPHTPIPELQESEVASAHWIPLELLHAPQAKYGVVGIDISSRSVVLYARRRARIDASAVSHREIRWLESLLSCSSVRCTFGESSRVSIRYPLTRGD